MSIRWELVYNHFGALANALPGRADDLAEQLAASARDKAEDNTVRIDTGDMKDGWRVASLGDGLWIVYNLVSYALFHEVGTYRMSASPMLGPAIADTESEFGALAAGFWSIP